MKTVAELANELDVSVQTIYGRLNKLERDNEELPTKKENGVMYITDSAEEAIKESLKNTKRSTKGKKIQEISSVYDELNFLREQNVLLQEELALERAHSREQAERVANLANRLAELSRNNQILLSEEQRRSTPVHIQNQSQNQTAIKPSAVKGRTVDSARSSAKNSSQKKKAPSRKGFFSLFGR